MGYEETEWQPPLSVLLKDPSGLLQALIGVAVVIMLLDTAFPSDVWRGYMWWLLPPLILLFVFCLLRQYLFRGIGSPIGAWILENIRCPACNGKLGSYVLGEPAYMSSRQSGTRYTAQCGNCKKKFVFGWTLIAPNIYLIGEVDEKMEREYVEEMKKARNVGLIIILIFLGLIIIAFVYFVLRYLIT
ncbi:MAG: hypothetical protein QXF56_01675 [Candidatus Micrarchaeia archaeon]